MKRLILSLLLLVTLVAATDEDYHLQLLDNSIRVTGVLPEGYYRLSIRKLNAAYTNITFSVCGEDLKLVFKNSSKSPFYKAYLYNDDGNLINMVTNDRYRK